MAAQTNTSFAEKTGVLVSRLSHPVVIQYGKEEFRLSPRETSKPVLRRLLGKLPAGVTFVPR